METPTAQFLTPKQRLFCDEYLTDRNATRAALRAGYSKETALSGYLTTLPKISMYLKEQCDAAAESARVTQDMVLRELSKIAFANMTHYFADGKPRPVDELNEDAAAALWYVQTDECGEIKIKLYNKLSALDKIAKHINFYKPEQQKKETVYVYLNKKELDEEDLFEDDVLRKQLREEKKKKKAEERRMMAEYGRLKADEPMADAVETMADDGFLKADDESLKADDKGLIADEENTTVVKKWPGASLDVRKTWPGGREDGRQRVVMIKSGRKMMAERQDNELRDRGVKEKESNGLMTDAEVDLYWKRKRAELTTDYTD